MKHTPGPWIALGLLYPFGWVIKHMNNNSGKEAIAYIQAYDIEYADPEPYGNWSEENKANHDLVLAAPDLLEACKRLLDAFYEDPLENDTASAVELAYDAIAKATGEEQ